MAAYLLVNVDVHDESVYAEYKARVPDVVRQFGGEYLARGGLTETLEGPWQLQRVALFRFPDADSARAFYQSEQYQPLKSLRQKVSEMDVVLIEGL
jgi:uncharacterized protein (DUF1330 family)